MLRRLPRELARKLAWRIIERTNPHDQPHIVFVHRRCGSKTVIPMGMYFDTWKEPAYQCLGCSCLTTDVEAQLVNQYDPEIAKAIEECETVLVYQVH